MKKYGLLIFIALQCYAQVDYKKIVDDAAKKTDIELNVNEYLDKMEELNQSFDKPDTLLQVQSNDDIEFFDVSPSIGKLISNNDVIEFTSYSYAGLGAYNCMTDEWVFNEFFINTILQLITDKYEEYEKECYADSTLECYNIYDSYGDISYIKCSTEHDFDLGFNPNYKGTEDIWVHREPTFKGYMEHLKKVIK